MSPEEHNRIVNATTAKWQKPIARSPNDLLLDKAQQITSAMRDHIRPILRAGGWKDKHSLCALITTLYLEAFNKAFDKDELLNICALLHMEIAMENIEANPYDNDAGPDALSGQ